MTMNMTSAIKDFKWVIKLLKSSKSKEHLDTTLRCFNLWENKHTKEILTDADADAEFEFWSGAVAGRLSRAELRQLFCILAAVFCISAEKLFSEMFAFVPGAMNGEDIYLVEKVEQERDWR